MALAFYLNNLVNQKGKSSIVEISTNSGSIAFTTYGLLNGSIKASYKNKWEAVMPTLESLSQVSQLFQGSEGNVISWLNGTSAAWSATDPVKINLDFYKITLNSKDDIKAEVGRIASLASLTGNTSGNTLEQNFTVKVHNGYVNNFWDGNNSLMGIKSEYSPGKKNEDGSYPKPSNLNNWGKQADLTTNPGTLTIKASGMTYSNMLLESIDVEPSRQMVAEGKPLYIRVNMSLRGVRACIARDINECFGLNIGNTGEYIASGDNGGSGGSTPKFGNYTQEQAYTIWGAYLEAKGLPNTTQITDKTMYEAIDWYKKNPNSTKNLISVRLIHWFGDSKEDKQHVRTVEHTNGAIVAKLNEKSENFIKTNFK